MAERWSRRSEMASLVLRTTISVPGTLRWRVSVPTVSRADCQRPDSKKYKKWRYPTVLSGHVCQPFPEWDTGREIKKVPDKWVSLWSRWIRRGGLGPPLQPVPCRNGDKQGKNKRHVAWVIPHDSVAGEGEIVSPAVASILWGGTERQHVVLRPMELTGRARDFDWCHGPCGNWYHSQRVFVMNPGIEGKYVNLCLFRDPLARRVSGGA